MTRGEEVLLILLAWPTLALSLRILPRLWTLLTTTLQIRPQWIGLFWSGLWFAFASTVFITAWATIPACVVISIFILSAGLSHRESERLLIDVCGLIVLINFVVCFTRTVRRTVSPPTGPVPRGANSWAGYEFQRLLSAPKAGSELFAFWLGYGGFWLPWIALFLSARGGH